MELPVLATACHVWVATPTDYAQPHSMEVGMMARHVADVARPHNEGPGIITGQWG